jgi:cytoskeletal protein CcmA (bactofilin family)
MFGKSKDDLDQLSAAVQQPQQPQPRPQPQPQVPAQRPLATKPVEPASADQVSTISRGMTVIGKIVGDGTLNVFGQVEGELQALNVMVNEGARVEGDLVAEDLTIGGQVKGSIRASRVKLKGTAVVEGDIFHRSLTIEENARFEGSSKRDDNAVEAGRSLAKRPSIRDESPAKVAVVEISRKANGVAPTHTPA